MPRITPATMALVRLGIEFELVVYDHDTGEPMTGQQVADVLGEPRPGTKTSMLQVDSRPVCVLVPSDRQVSMKKVAATLGGKTAKMMAADDWSTRRVTGSAPSVRSVRNIDFRRSSNRRCFGRPTSMSAAAGCGASAKPRSGTTGNRGGRGNGAPPARGGDRRPNESAVAEGRD